MCCDELRGPERRGRRRDRCQKLATVEDGLLYLTLKEVFWYELPRTLRGLAVGVRRLYLPSGASGVMNQVSETKKTRGQSLKIKYFVNVAMAGTPPPAGGGRDRRAMDVMRSPRAHLTSDMVGYHGRGLGTFVRHAGPCVVAR